MRQLINIALCLLAIVLPGIVNARMEERVPWSVPSETAVEQRHLIVENRGAKLSGTMFMPSGSTPSAVVIGLHGAQAPLRTEPLYQHLTQILPRLGIAVFLYDRRGSGKSTSGGAAPGNFDLLADDAVAAFEKVRHERGIDPAKIGFWGLSQGGWLALLAAKKEQRAAFAIAISAPMATADIQMNFAVANILRIQGKPPAVIDRAIGARTVIDDYVRGRRTRADAERAEAGIRGEPWYRDTWLRGNIDDPEWKQQISNNPLRALAGSRVPTLVVFGQEDPWVPVGASLAALRSRSADFPQAVVRVIDGADHAMMLGVPPDQQVDASLAAKAAPNAPAYFALMGAWLYSFVGT